MDAVQDQQRRTGAAAPHADSHAEQLAKSRREVERLRQQLSSMQVGQGEAAQFAATILPAIDPIAEMTLRLFPGPLSIEYAYDPENPSDQWLVFDVVAQGEYKDYRDRQFQWHEEVRAIVPGESGEFRLSIIPLR